MAVKKCGTSGKTKTAKAADKKDTKKKPTKK